MARQRSRICKLYADTNVDSDGVRLKKCKTGLMVGTAAAATCRPNPVVARCASDENLMHETAQVLISCRKMSARQLCIE